MTKGKPSVEGLCLEGDSEADKKFVLDSLDNLLKCNKNASAIRIHFNGNGTIRKVAELKDGAALQWCIKSALFVRISFIWYLFRGNCVPNEYKLRNFAYFLCLWSLVQQKFCGLTTVKSNVFNVYLFMKNFFFGSQTGMLMWIEEMVFSWESS